MKVAELTGALLDYWVARAQGRTAKLVKPGERINDFLVREHHSTQCFALTNGSDDWFQNFNPSTVWSCGGPIIERDEIDICYSQVDADNDPGREEPVLAHMMRPTDFMIVGKYGCTALEAAMRVKVASIYGDTVPDEVPA